MFEIPWELLELKRDIFLGSEFMATRWQNISDPDNFDDLDANIELIVCSQDCCGEVVAYLNTKDLESVKEEQEMLQEKFQSKQIYPDIKEFLNFLDGVQDNVGLVFIASHGFFGSDISASGLGGEDRREKISLAELYEYDFDFFEKCKSIVFMNTCHSGRLQKKDQLHLVSPDNSIGFSTFFLEKGAAGVIGTLCEVADNYAAKVSRNFFNEWEKNSNLTVAKILTNLRYQSLENYRQEKTDENKFLLLITFMYVYYGNPMARLNLVKGGRE
jgi:CHAT domain-containing protein